MLYHVVSPCFQSMDAVYRVTGFGIYEGQFVDVRLRGKGKVFVCALFIR